MRGNMRNAAVVRDTLGTHFTRPFSKNRRKATKILTYRLYKVSAKILGSCGRGIMISTFLKCQWQEWVEICVLKLVGAFHTSLCLFQCA